MIVEINQRLTPALKQESANFLRRLGKRDLVGFRDQSLLIVSSLNAAYCSEAGAQTTLRVRQYPDVIDTLKSDQFNGLVRSRRLGSTRHERQLL